MSPMRVIEVKTTNSSIEIPLYCPLCGRWLVEYHWQDSEQTTEYPSVVCYNGRHPILVWLVRHLASHSSPTGAHYEFQMPPIVSVDPLVDRPIRPTNRCSAIDPQC